MTLSQDLSRIMNLNKHIVAGPGQESVWDYPRPPRVEATSKRIRVMFGTLTIADSRRAFRVLETSHPPTYYLPPEDVWLDYLVAVEQRSLCEFKGMASHYSVSMGSRVSDCAAWYYPKPTRAFNAIKGYIAFYPNRVDACYVDDEKVRSQPGDFYGGWITSEIIGPFKAGPVRSQTAEN